MRRRRKIMKKKTQKTEKVNWSKYNTKLKFGFYLIIMSGASKEKKQQDG